MKLRAGLMVAVLVLPGAGLPAAQAQEADAGGILSEVRLGAAFHEIHPKWVPWDVTAFDFSQFEDVNFEVLFRSPDVSAFELIGAPRPSLGTTISTTGKVSMAHLGLDWQLHLGDSPFFVEGTVGIGMHDGHLERDDNGDKGMGCRFGFYSALGVGVDLDEDWTLSATYEHVSNAGLCSPNDGLTNLGIRLGYKFD